MGLIYLGWGSSSMTTGAFHERKPATTCEVNQVIVGLNSIFLGKQENQIIYY